MGTFLEDKDRNIIPRLRSFGRTLALGELIPAGLSNDGQSELDGGDSLRSKIEAWEKNRTISFAADLVSAAFVLQQTDEAGEAAQFILSKESGSSEAARNIAKRIRDPEGQDVQGQIAFTSPSLPHSDEIFQKIHSTRRQLHDEPRNSILWVELSRQYALLGAEDKATQAMNNAVAMAPTNRFVLRSASRLYIHVGRAGKAHYILERAESTKHDPWLLSAEIATASAAKRPSRLVTTGLRMLVDDSIGPFEKNELASAIGTLELANGKTKNARRLFRQSLIDPTENSVAQAEWALRNRHVEALDMNLERIRDETPLSFEASAWGSFTVGDWKQALRLSLGWLRDQPFSTRPVLLGSYIAACLLEDYRSCERILEVGLRANPDEPIFLNNLAFAYASAGDIDKAEKQFLRIDPSKIRDVSEEIAITATQGLLLFRRGYPEDGRALYRLAIDEARKRGMGPSSAIASIYLAREEILLKSAEAEKAVEFAMDETEGISDSHIKAILQQVLDTRNSERQLSQRRLE